MSACIVSVQDTGLSCITRETLILHEKAACRKEKRAETSGDELVRSKKQQEMKRLPHHIRDWNAARLWHIRITFSIRCSQLSS